MKVMDVFYLKHLDRYVLSTVVEDKCPWTGDVIVRTRDGAEFTILGVEQFAKFDKERRTPIGMKVGIVLCKDSGIIEGDEFTVRYTNEPPKVVSRQPVAQRDVELFARLANDPSEGANDS